MTERYYVKRLLYLECVKWRSCQDIGDEEITGIPLTGTNVDEIPFSTVKMPGIVDSGVNMSTIHQNPTVKETHEWLVETLVDQQDSFVNMVHCVANVVRWCARVSTIFFSLVMDVRNSRIKSLMYRGS